MVRERQKFLRAVDVPVAAPSANVSKHISPVTARHVFEDFEGRIPLILDGGRCEGGIESTVLDCTGETPQTLGFYESCGYSVFRRERDFFTKNYSRPIIDGGVLLRDMIYLRKKL